MYGPMGRIIAFHDILSNPRDVEKGMSDFWRSIKDDYPSQEIIENEWYSTNAGKEFVEKLVATALNAEYTDLNRH